MSTPKVFLVFFLTLLLSSAAILTKLTPLAFLLGLPTGWFMMELLSRIWKWALWKYSWWKDDRKVDRWVKEAKRRGRFQQVIMGYDLAAKDGYCGIAAPVPDFTSTCAEPGANEMTEESIMDALRMLEPMKLDRHRPAYLRAGALFIDHIKTRPVSAEQVNYPFFGMQIHLDENIPPDCCDFYNERHELVERVYLDGRTFKPILPIPTRFNTHE